MHVRDWAKTSISRVATTGSAPEASVLLVWRISSQNLRASSRGFPPASKLKTTMFPGITPNKPLCLEI